MSKLPVGMAALGISFLLATALYFIVILVFVRVQRTLEARISEEPGAA